MDAKPPSPAWQRAARLARLLFTPMALTFLLVAAWGASDLLGHVVTTARPAPLLAAVLLWASLHWIAPVTPSLILASSPGDVGYLRALAIHLHRLPARYIPGGVWQTVSRLVDFRHHGVQRRTLAVLVITENLAPLGIAMLLGALLHYAGGGSLKLIPWIGAAGLALVLSLPVFLCVDRHGAERLSFGRYLGVLGASTVFWLGAAGSFALFWSALDIPDSGGSLLLRLGIYLIAWSVGYVSIFSPQGIGVFEFVVAWMMKGALPLASLVALAAGFRVLTLAGDVIAYGVGRIFVANRPQDGPAAN